MHSNVNVNRRVVNDKIAMECPACAKKHLSAAIAYYADAITRKIDPPTESGICVARAMINLNEADEGYTSHADLATGLMVMAEEAERDPKRKTDLREARLDGDLFWKCPMPSLMEMYLGHVQEAFRECPSVVSAVERDSFYEGKTTQSEMYQAEIEYRLAQIRWIENNRFPKEEKGDNTMAIKKAKPQAKKSCGKVKRISLEGKKGKK